MTTKTSQKTEDMLDQTFANFDQEVTGAETQTESPGKVAPNAGKKSSNLILFIGLGVAAVGSIGYLFILKPMLQPQQIQQVQQVQQVQPAQMPVVVQQVPVTAPIVVAPVEVAQVPVVAATPVASAPIVVAPVEVAQVPVVAATPVANTQTATVPMVKSSEVKPSSVQVAGVSQATVVVDELKNMFEQQSNEFRTVLTDVDSRVTVIEGALTEQKTVNENVDKRLVALEVKKTKHVIKSTVSRTHKAASIVKKSEKESIVDKSILVDKTTSVAVKQKEEIKSSYANIDFHSIYGGRVWLKNKDGSLSTFSAGDKLPTGETIKKINDETFEVTTDKIVIKN